MQIYKYLALFFASRDIYDRVEQVDDDSLYFNNEIWPFYSSKYPVWQPVQSISSSSQSSLQSLSTQLAHGGATRRLTTENDYIRRGIRSGLCDQCHKTGDEIVEDADEKLFSNIIYNKLHVLNHILPDTRDIKYHLRPRSHNLKLPVKNSSISQSDFITRMLFKDVYCKVCLSSMSIFLSY